MAVVSNTSPLLNLAVIDELELIRSQLGVVTISPGVRDELKVEKARPGSKALRQAIEEDEWLRIQHPSDTDLVKTLRRDVHRGEAEAIALARELEAELILLDDREARLHAKRLNLNVTGLLGILLRSRRDGEIDSLRELLDRLEAEAGFWISPSLRTRILTSAGESDR